MGSSFRKRLAVGFLALTLVIVGGTFGYWLLGRGDWKLSDCLYMTVISVTTVGYGEVLPGMDVHTGARLFTMLLLVVGTGVLVYFASMLAGFVIEGELKDLLDTRKREKRVRRMKEHIVVCGAGSTGRHIIEELLRGGASTVVAIDRDAAALTALQEAFPKAHFNFLVGDATDDAMHEAAAMGTARGVVAALSADKDNLYVVVSARQLSATARIIARCSELAHVDKIRRAGADAVVSPNYIGGMRMASELVRPAVVKFLDEMMRDARAAYRIEQVTVTARGAAGGATLGSADIRARYGMTVLAVRTPAGPWTYNPDAGTALREGMELVVLGEPTQVGRLRDDL
jgi:voltage-gated potassium channel